MEMQPLELILAGPTGDQAVGVRGLNRTPPDHPVVTGVSDNDIAGHITMQQIVPVVLRLVLVTGADLAIIDQVLPPRSWGRSVLRFGADVVPVITREASSRGLVPPLAV